MLNAYWHQRFGQFNCWEWQLRQRFVLNAYWHQRFGQIPINANDFKIGSAQRLLASKVWAVVSFQARLDLLTVLNAYWHQRFGQVILFVPGLKKLSVLNAYWHQRFGQPLNYGGRF